MSTGKDRRTESNIQERDGRNPDNDKYKQQGTKVPAERKAVAVDALRLGNRKVVQLFECAVSRKSGTDQIKDGQHQQDKVHDSTSQLEL